MRNLISFSNDGKVNMNRTIDQFVFNFYVREGSDFNKCWEAFYKYVVSGERANYNQYWFSPDRLMHDVTSVWEKFDRNKESRKDASIKGSSLLEIVMNLFNKSNKEDVFISQAACARVLGTNQMAISRELKDMIDQGIIQLVERGSKIAKKCSVYSIAEKGLSIFSKMFGKIREIMEKTVESVSEELQKFRDQLDILRKNALKPPKDDERTAREKELEYVYKRREILA